MVALTGSSKLFAMILSILIIGGASVAYYTYFANDNANDKHWVPKQARATPFAPSAAVGERAMADQALGSYMESSGLGYSLFPNRQTVYIDPTMTEGEVLSVAKDHPKISEFLANHPQYDNWTYYDGSRWYVNFYDYNVPEDWAYVIIRDVDATIIQIYVIQGNDVYLDWPTARLDADRVLEIVGRNEVVQDYLAYSNISLFDAWVWFDGNDTWFVSYSFYFALEYARDASVGVPNQEDLGFTEPVQEVEAPASEERLIAPDFNPYWMEIHVSDFQAEVTRIQSNFEKSAYLENTMEEIIDYVKSLDIYQQFAEGHTFLYPWVTIAWDYTSNDNNARWIVSSYAWESQTLEPLQYFNNVFYWSSDYLNLVLSDSDLTILSSFSTPKPQMTPEDMLGLLLENQTVLDFVSKYGENNGYLSFDPFTSSWWISIYPSWTWGAYLSALIKDDGQIDQFYIQHIPDELLPTRSIDEVRTVLQGLDQYSEFVETYEVYGDVISGLYYSYDYEGTSKSWVAYAWSEVIGEAYLNVEIDDQSLEVLSVTRYDPRVPPTHNTSEIISVVEQVQEVQDFLNEVQNPTIWISYYSTYGEINQSGIWYITYSSPDYSRQISIQVDDATLEIISIYQYPEN